MNRRPIIQKTIGRKQQKLRDSAKFAPYCMGCSKPNHDGHQLCLAHSNSLSDGKGRGLKAIDSQGSAILCNDCHNYADGRGEKATRAEMQDFHYSAHCRTRLWWIKMGLVSPQ